MWKQKRVGKLKEKNHEIKIEYVYYSTGAHKKAILAIDINKKDSHKALTCSDDKTLRLWDLKSKISVRMLSCPELTKAKQVANCLFGPDNSIFVAADK